MYDLAKKKKQLLLSMTELNNAQDFQEHNWVII